MIWSFWHFPMFSVPESSQRGSFWPFAANLTAWSILLTAIYTGSGGSILLCMGFHASANICALTISIPEETPDKLAFCRSWPHWLPSSICQIHWFSFPDIVDPPTGCLSFENRIHVCVRSPRTRTTVPIQPDICA